MFIFFYNFFPPPSLSDFKLLQKDLLSLFIYYSIFFLIQIRVQATNKPVSQVLCLERLQTHVLRFETKLSQIFFFYCFQNYILLFNYVRASVYLKTVKLLFCVTISFNIMIHFPTQRSLVKILGYGEGGGRGFRIGNMCTPVADSC